MKIDWSSLKFWQKKTTTLRGQSGFEIDTNLYTLTSSAMRGTLVNRVTEFLIRWSVWFQIKTQPVLRRMNWQLIRGTALVLALSFVSASVVSTYSAKLAFSMSSRAEASLDLASRQSPLGSGPITTAAQGSSARALENLILKRNLFNSEGTLAPDAGTDGQQSKNNDLDFNTVPCSFEKLPVDVLGTIFTGDAAASFVAIKDPKIQDADIYKVGEVIIDHEDFEVWRVKQGFAEFRRGDQKVCVDVAGRAQNVAGASQSTEAPRPEVTESVDIPDSEMKALLGPELAIAMNAAKLIPEVQPGTGQVQGFRLLAIVPGSIFDRLKLQNEDLIAEVNGVSLKDPTQGFRLLESLQQQREISINFIRKGEPMVRKVRVK